MRRVADLLTAERVFACALILAAISWLAFFNAHKRIVEAGGLPGSDFVAFYTGAVLAGCCTDELYHAPAQFSFEQSLGSAQFKGWRLYYLYPPFFSAGLVPLGYLSYTEAYWLWTALSLIFFGLSLVILPRQNSAARICTIAAANPALHWVLLSGQTTALGVVLWTLAYHFLRNGRLFLSGVVFALLAYRPQFLILVLPICLIKLPRRVMSGFALCLLALLLLGGIVISFDSYRQYGILLVEFMEQLRENVHPLNLHVSIYGFFRQLVPENWSMALAGGVSLLVVYWLIRGWTGPLEGGSDAFDLQMASLITSTLLVMSHSLVYDLLLLTIVALIMKDHKIHFPAYYKVLLASLYLFPLLFFFFAGSFRINPIPPLLVWLCFEIYRARRKCLAHDRRSGSSPAIGAARSCSP
mgnify:FL=1